MESFVYGTEAYSETFQISKIDLFAKFVNDFFLDALHGSEYTTARKLTANPEIGKKSTLF